MELITILYLIAGAVGFVFLYILRQLTERPSVLPDWVSITYKIIAIVLLLLTIFYNRAENAKYESNEFRIISPNNTETEPELYKIWPK